MLLARATTAAGDDLLLIGLSKENRKKLDDGQPIAISHISQGPGGRPLRLVIFAGLDEDSMQQELGPLIGGETRVIDYRENDRQEVQ